MGANAQTKVPTFASAEVLTAANQNLLSNGIPVFSGTATRDAAFGGSGEKVLAEGQFAFLEDSNSTQFYDGAAWQSVGVTPGLVFITGASFSSATTISMAAGVFTSTYKTYQVVFQTTSGGDCQFSVRVNNAGTPRTGGDYFGYSTRSAPTGVSATASSATTSLNIGAQTSTNGYWSQYVAYVFSPTETLKTQFVFVGNGSNDSNAPAYITAGGTYSIAEANDGLTFLLGAAGTGFYRVYGLSES
jgi:hypothetical protein